jgi:hypoxanthine phosphoribosyltransferase
MDKTLLGFTEIAQRIREMGFPEVDLVLGIATGGTVPASLAAFYLNKPLKMLWINYRDEENVPRHESPQLLAQVGENLAGKRVLLVDDVSVSGKTLGFAKSLLKDCEVTTFVMKGNADLSAFPEIANCVRWPWKE